MTNLYTHQQSQVNKPENTPSNLEAQKKKKRNIVKRTFLIVS